MNRYEDFYSSLTFPTRIGNGMENALTDPDITAAREKVGYDEQEMEVGKAKYDAANAAYIDRDLEYGEKLAATQDLKALREEADRVVTRHFKYARLVFKKDPAALSKLDITGYWRKRLDGKIDQATHFYEALLADERLVKAMNRFRITREELQEGRDQVEQVKALMGERMAEEGDAEQSTQDRNQLFNELDDWWDDFIAAMKIELADKPQLLEKLGVQIS